MLQFLSQKLLTHALKRPVNSSHLESQSPVGEPDLYLDGAPRSLEAGALALGVDLLQRELVAERLGDLHV